MPNHEAMLRHWAPTKAGVALTGAPRWSIQLEPLYFVFQVGTQTRRFDILDAEHLKVFAKTVLCSLLPTVGFAGGSHFGAVLR